MVQMDYKSIGFANELHVIFYFSISFSIPRIIIDKVHIIFSGLEEPPREYKELVSLNFKPSTILIPIVKIPIMYTDYSLYRLNSHLNRY